jgi:hypothetical protein
MGKKPAYQFHVNVTPEQAQTIIETYNGFPLDGKPEVDVFAKICEILYDNGFRAYPDGMHRRETNCHFNWKDILKYKTVVDFQLANVFFLK